MTRITKEWLRQKIEAEPDDMEVEAGCVMTEREALLQAHLELITNTARRYISGDATLDAFEAALDDAYGEAADAAELRTALASSSALNMFDSSEPAKVALSDIAADCSLTDGQRRAATAAFHGIQAAEAERDTLKAQVAGLSDPSHDMTLAVARAIGGTMGIENHMVRARTVIKAVAETLSPSTRTAALIRAGEAAVEETRAEKSFYDIEPYSGQRLDKAKVVRCKACAAVPDADPGSALPAGRER